MGTINIYIFTSHILLFQGGVKKYWNNKCAPLLISIRILVYGVVQGKISQVHKLIIKFPNM